MFFLAAAIAMTALSAGYSAYSSYKTGKAQEAQAREDARQVKLDRIAQEQEEVEMRRRQRAANRREQGAIEAAVARQGLAMEGSPLVAFSLNAARQEMELSESKRMSDIYGSQARRKEAGILYGGYMAAKAGRIGATSAILSGAANIASMGASYKGG